MSACATAEGASAKHYLVLLDGLIQHHYSILCNQDGSNLRVADFLRMIELRHKLTPEDADQRAFWAEMERIRQNALSKDGRPGEQPASVEPPAEDERTPACLS